MKVPRGLFIDNVQQESPKKIGELNVTKSVGGMDSSYSAEGEILEAEGEIVSGIIPNGEYYTWSSILTGPKMVSDISSLEADGSTYPSLFTNAIQGKDYNSYILTTDGQVGDDEVRKMASCTSLGHMPNLLMLFNEFDSTSDISRSNVSVLLPSFNMSIDTALIIYNMNDNQMYLIAVKGVFSKCLPSPPQIEEGIQLKQFPTVKILQLRDLPIYQYPPIQDGSIRLDDGRNVCSKTFLQITDPEVMKNFTKQDIEKILSIFHTLGSLPQVRAMLNKLDLECKKTVQESSSDSKHDSISQLILNLSSMTDRHSQEASSLRLQIKELLKQQQQERDAAKAKAKEEQNNYKALIQFALATITHLEQAGNTASALSNRAGRAKDVGECIPLEDLNHDESLQSECLITMTIKTMAIMCKYMQDPDANISSDFALNFGLSTGKQNNSVICNGTLGTTAADNVDTNPFTREPVNFIPIVSLADKTNRNEVFKRLCMIFMGGKAMGHVWLIALAAFVETIRTQEWAKEGTTIHDCLMFMIHQIMDNVVAPCGSFINPNASCPIKDAIASALNRDIMQEHYPINGVCVSLWLNKLNPSVKTPLNDRQRHHILIARMHAMIVTNHLSWLKQGGKVKASPLWTTIFDVRTDHVGIFQPILNTQRLCDSLRNVLPQSVINDLDHYMHDNGNTKGADDLICPSTSAVILDTLKNIHPYLKPSDAIAKVAQNVGSAFNSDSVMVDEAQDVLTILKNYLTMKQYAMSSLPPFCTELGPSVVFFYEDTNINMAKGTPYHDRLPQNEEEWLKFTEMIRKIRQDLLDQYQNFQNGSFKSTTNATTLHKAMVRIRAEGVDPESPEFGVQVLHYIMSSNKGAIHDKNLEMKIAMLIPSLLATPQVSIEYLEENISLMNRLKLELGDAPPCRHEPQHSVWVPNDTAFRERVHQYRTLMNEKIQQRIQQIEQQSSAVQSLANLSTMKNEKVSHIVCRLLRHSISPKLISSSGWVKIRDIITVFESRNKKVTLEQLNTVTTMDNKMRFSIKEKDGEFYMRANNGHTLTKVEPEALMERIDEEDAPLCIHGTNSEAWDSIKTKGLSPMGRNCIHMATGPYNDPNVKSGIRKTSEIYIWINIVKAIQDGIPFYRTANGVICTPQVIAPEYFSRVENIKIRELIQS